MNTVLLKSLLKKEVANIVRKEHFPVQNMDQHCNDVVKLALIIIHKPKGGTQQSNQMTSVSNDRSQWTDLLSSGKSSTPLWQSTVDPRYYSLDRGETSYNVDQEHAQQALKNVAMSLKRYDPVVLEKKAKQEAIVRRPPPPPKGEQVIRKPETLYRGTVAEAKFDASARVKAKDGSFLVGELRNALKLFDPTTMVYAWPAGEPYYLSEISTDNYHTTSFSLKLAPGMMKLSEADKNGNPKDNEVDPKKKPDTNPPTPPAQPGDQGKEVEPQHVSPPPPTDVPPNEKPKKPEPKLPDPEQVPAKEVPEKPEQPETPEEPEQPEETPPEGEEEVPPEEKVIGKDEAKSIIKLLMKFKGQKVPDVDVKRLSKQIGILPEKINAFIYGLALKYVQLHIVRTKEPKQQMQEQWQGAKPDMPVQLVGVKQTGTKYEITRDGQGVVVFPNLAAAQKAFPDLNPNGNSKNFTWAMRGEVKNPSDRFSVAVPAIRFETWAANDIYSK